MADLRLRLACKPHGQAGFCHCTLKLITVQFEPTFARLRYSLGNCINLDVSLSLRGEGNLYNISGIK